MTEQGRILELDFELERPQNPAGPEAQADLERSAAAVQQAVAALPGVSKASTEAAKPDRTIDPVSLGIIALTIKYVIKDSTEIVESLDDLVNQLKKLGHDLGLPHLKAWLGTTKIDASELTPDKLQELADQPPPTRNPS
jgi:hypothetical protein